jgi:L-ribulokinase
MLVAPTDEMQERLVRGICGQVNGSIIPGMTGLEAGQSAFGDTFAWFKNILSWPLQMLSNSAIIDRDLVGSLQKELADKIIPELSVQASQIAPDEKSELGIDWLNGRRTPDANQNLKAALFGLTLGTSSPHLFSALVESTCFGAKAIVDRFVDEGVAVKGLIGLGGVAKKSPYIMQVMADVMNMPIRVHKSEQTCALGAAMFAATLAGIYNKVEDAMEDMGQGFDKEYHPDKRNASIYAKRYGEYLKKAALLENEEVVLEKK